MKSHSVAAGAFVRQYQVQLIRLMPPAERFAYLLRYPSICWDYLFLQIRLSPKHIPPPLSEPPKETLCEAMLLGGEYDGFSTVDGFARCDELERRLSERIGREELLKSRDKCELSSHHALWQAGLAVQCKEGTVISRITQLLRKPQRIFYYLSV